MWRATHILNPSQLCNRESLHMSKPTSLEDREFITYVISLEYSAVEFLFLPPILQSISLDFLPECPSLIKPCFFLSLLVIIGLKCYVLLPMFISTPSPRASPCPGVETKYKLVCLLLKSIRIEEKPLKLISCSSSKHLLIILEDTKMNEAGPMPLRLKSIGCPWRF